MSRTKIVQIGLGHDHAADVLDSMLSLPDVFEVVGFAVPECEESEFAERITKYRDELKIPKLTVEEALNYPGITAVTVETEEKNLTKYSLMAAEKGLHIHMDKPGGLDLPLFEKLIDKLKENKLVFSIGYMYRFNTAVVDVMEKIKNGELGDIYSIEAHMNCEHPINKRQWLDRFKGGMMFFLGCHLIDIVYRIQGEPEEVIPLNASTGYEGVTAEDFGMAVFRYKNGASVIKTCDSEPGGFMRRQLVICGTKGTVEIRPLEAYDFEEAKKHNRADMYNEVRYIKADGGWCADCDRQKSELYNRYDAMMCNFADMVKGEKENLYSYDYELNLYKLLLKACGA